MRDETMIDYYRHMNEKPKKRKSPTKRVRKAFDRAELKRICEMHEDEFFDEFDMEIVPVQQHYPDDYYLFRNHGSSVLAVAHLDTVVRPQARKCGFLDTAGGPVVYSGALDDRLGAYIILDLLPALGIQYDILLTVGEENGMSTAQFFEPPEDKVYDWMIEFDRGGTDVVMYQYDDTASRDLVRASGATPADGIFSDIAYLEHLKIKGFNWGVGYRDYHGPRSHAYLDDTYQMVAHFLNFHEDNYGTHLHHERSRSWSRHSWWGGYGTAWDDPDETAMGSVDGDVVDAEFRDDRDEQGEPLLGVYGADPFAEDPEDLISEDSSEVQRALALLDARASEDPEAPIPPVDEDGRSLAWYEEEQFD